MDLILWLGPWILLHSGGVSVATSNKCVVLGGDLRIYLKYENNPEGHSVALDSGPHKHPSSNLLVRDGYVAQVQESSQ